jgi:hypothetical protein
VQIILGLAKQLQPHVWLNVHSGMYALFTPYDHQPRTPDTPEARAALRMLQVRALQRLTGPTDVSASGGVREWSVHGSVLNLVWTKCVWCLLPQPGMCGGTDYF